MSTVPAVHSTADSPELGITYMHEHVFVLTTGVQAQLPRRVGDEQARIADRPHTGGTPPA
jgi:phosphotriesterase-related protein